MVAPASEARVLITDLQLLTPEDMTDIGALGEATLDNVVDTFLSDGLGYADMQVAPLNTDKVTVAAGLLYSGGKGHALREAYTVDLATNIASTPDGQFRKVLIVATTSDAPAVLQDRSLLDATKKPTNVRDPWPTTTLSLFTRNVRTAVIQKVVGDAAIQPDAPLYPASACLIATVTISHTAVTDIVMEASTKIESLLATAAKVASLMAFQASAGALFEALKSSVGQVALLLNTKFAAMDDVFKALTNRIVELEKARAAGLNAVLAVADPFIDYSQSQQDAPGFSVIVSEGLRFPVDGSNAAETLITADNPSATNIRIMDNKMMPAFTEVFGAQSDASRDVERNRKSRPVGSVSMASLATASFDFVRRAFALYRTRWAPQLVASLGSQVSPLDDPSSLFGLPDYVYNLAWGDWRTFLPELMRRAGFWRSLASRGYWSEILATVAMTNLPVISQVFAPSAQQMITAIQLPIIAYPVSDAQMRVVVTKAINGEPDPANTLVDMTFNASTLFPAGNSDPTKLGLVKMPYPILVGGTQGPICVLVMCASSVVMQYVPESANAAPGVLGGPPKVRVGNAWRNLDGVRELGLAFRVAKFNGTSTRVSTYTPLSLAGGIDSVDIVASAIVPDGCDINYEVNIGGAPVRVAEPSGAHPLSGRPNNLPLAVIYSHTEAVAPIIHLPKTKGRVTRQANTFLHVSTTRNPTVSVTQVFDEVVFDKLDNAYHTLVARLLTGTYSSPTETAPSDVKTEVLADGAVRKTFSYVVSAVANFRTKLTATTSDPAKPVIGRERRTTAKA